MVLKLKQEAIEDIYNVVKNVSEIENYMKAIGFCYTSDCWRATNVSLVEDEKEMNCSNENIFDWTKKEFEDINIEKVNKFFIGGSVSTGEFKYKNE